MRACLTRMMCLRAKCRASIRIRASRRRCSPCGVSSAMATTSPCATTSSISSTSRSLMPAVNARKSISASVARTADSMCYWCPHCGTNVLRRRRRSRQSVYQARGDELRLRAPGMWVLPWGTMRRTRLAGPAKCLIHTPQATRPGPTGGPWRRRSSCQYRSTYHVATIRPSPPAWTSRIQPLCPCSAVIAWPWNCRRMACTSCTVVVRSSEPMNR